ncbi:hypothetical protein DPMN_037038, partial [Dreissena polymorpha]
KNAPPPHSHVFKPNGIIFKLVQDIIGMNILTKFHEDQTINVASRVKNAPPLGSHKRHVLTKFHEDWTKNLTTRVFTLNCPAPWRPYINETNVSTNFHDDWAKIVTSRVFTRNTALPPGGHVFQRTGTIFELNQHII